MMNYQRIYNDIIERGKQDELAGLRKRKNGNYYERHHIIPRCMNGNNDKENLVLLTAREHFLCHWLLCKIYPNIGKLICAFWAMCNQNTKPIQCRIIPSSRIYEEGRKIFSDYIKNVPPHLQSNETKNKISASLKKHYETRAGTFFGRQHTTVSKDKMSKSANKRIQPENVKKKISKSLMGHAVSDKTKLKLRERNKLGLSIESRIRISNTFKQKQLIKYNITEELYEKLILELKIGIKSVKELAKLYKLPTITIYDLNKRIKLNILNLY